MPEPVSGYRCSYCHGRIYRSELAIKKHEVCCFNNPNRVPYPGELGAWSIWFNGKWHPLINFCVDERQVPDMYHLLEKVKPEFRLMALFTDHFWTVKQQSCIELLLKRFSPEETCHCLTKFWNSGYSNNQIYREFSSVM